MRFIKQIALGTFLALGVYCAVIYSSCTKDACKTVNCLNGGTCNGGGCMCDTGIGGTNCQTIYRELYGGLNGSTGQNYLGNAIFSYPSLDSAQLASGYANHTDANNTLKFTYGNDSSYSKMHLTWTDGSTTMLSAAILLVSNTAAGSTFSITPTAGGPGGAYTISGSGTVSTISASANLLAVPTNTVVPTIYITLSNCTKQ